MIEIGSALDTGIRRSGKENQDAICVMRLDESNGEAALLVVADGMGGYDGGAVASRQVIDNFSNAIRNAGGDVDPLQALQTGITSSLQALKQHAKNNPNLLKMGSTVVAAVTQGSKVHLINVGDSRAYLINQHSIRQISFDHSLVGALLRQGQIDEEEARVHPRRNVLSMAISVQREQVESFSTVIDWQPGDVLVLCSDGLWGPVTQGAIQAAVLEFPPQQAAEKLVQLANNNMGPDNISVIVARFR
jgi:PPM family protein phosphatase